MATGLSAHFINLVQDCLLKSFWRKNPLRAFLRRSGISPALLGQLHDSDTKRLWLDLVFSDLDDAENGAAVIQRMGRWLAEQVAFPDLEKWEDSAEKIRAAKEAVSRLKDYFANKDREKEQEKEIIRKRRAAEEVRQKTLKSQADLTSLQQNLEGELLPQLGTQGGGYAFQSWFYDLMDYFDVDNRRPYVSDGRQIDGSVTIDGTTYLVELKFTSEQSGATDIDSLLKKVTDKADNTMGLLVSMSGFSSVAINEASFARSPLLLLDNAHVYMVLTGIETFPNVVRRVRRHSSQEGKAYLPVNEFGGRE